MRYPTWTSSLPPAPGDLRLIQAFVNTRNLAAGTDELDGAVALGAWLARWGLLLEGTPISAQILGRARDVREGLRALLMLHNRATADRKALARLNLALASTALRARFTDEGSAHLEPTGHGWDSVVARLVEMVLLAMKNDTWARLKVCRNEECLRAFYDSSKNRSGKWCSMRRCGNQINARAYRRRQTRRP